jgi:Sec7-like guanine-nucleotide exchange factor
VYADYHIVHKLVYSLILLNTDIHIVNVKSSHGRMSKRDFISNTLYSLAPANDGENTDSEFRSQLGKMYDSIRSRPILQPDNLTAHKRPDGDKSPRLTLFNRLTTSFRQALSTEEVHSSEGVSSLFR